MNYEFLLFAKMGVTHKGKRTLMKGNVWK